METIERSHVSEFYRYKRRRMPIPVSPPKLPSTYSSKLGLVEKHTNYLHAEPNILLNGVFKNLEVAQPTPADSNFENVADGPHSKCSPFDYINDSVENVSKSVDKKGEENDGCNLPSAPFAAAAAASKIQENLSSTTSASAADAAVGVFYARKVLSGDEDDEFVGGGGGGVFRVFQSTYTSNRQVESSSDGYISSRQRQSQKLQKWQNLQKLQRCQQSRPVTVVKDCAMEVNFENSSRQPHLQFGGCGVEQNGVGDVLAKFRRHCSESMAKSFDHRIRYGLSNLEIYSKYSSRRSDIGLRSENGLWSGSEERFTSGASTAATFFARASEKLKLNSSPHRRKKRGSSSEDGASASVRCVGGFCNLLHRSPPAVPSALLRKLGQKEVAGIGKVKVILKVCGDTTAPQNSPEDGLTASILNVDKKKKQIALYEPATVNASTSDNSDERKPSTSAPKMFAFDALFSEEDPQTEICANALTDVTHAVISGNDGCIFCFGNAQVGKTKTMIGSCDSSSALGMIPCAISWLYKAVSEQKQKTGARFSIRVSAVEITAGSQQIRDLLTDYASDTEQSPGVYLKDDPILGSHLQNRSELRAPFPEKAAFYLDAAQSERTTCEESHFLYTLHVYQYNVASKGTVAGGRSRLYLIDLAGHDRTKNSGLSISNLGNVLLAIFNGQKHIPHRDHKITQILKECLSSLTCHAAAIAHISPLANHYHETLATVQFASRIHRIRRRKLKFNGVSNGINTTTDENGRLTSSSDFDPSSSEQSADTVIYVGPSEETDGEHPPVCIPSLNSVDNRGVLSKVLRDSDPDCFLRGSKSVPASPYKTAKVLDKPNLSPLVNAGSKKHHPKPSGFHSAHSSPVRTAKLQEEQWIDGPRISKSKVAEARNVHLMRNGQKMFGKREMWVDGPMKKGPEIAYGFMDSHKKSMIRKWVENQSMQLQSRSQIFDMDNGSQPYKVLTVFKTCENDETDDGIRGQGSGQEEDDQEEPTFDRVVPYGQTEDPEPRLRMIGSSNIENCIELEPDGMDDDMEIEIIEVEEPEEPVPMQDCCLQVTEEDIALCMGELENPLPEVDQEEHPLRVLSQENLTVVSTFTDSMSVVNDLERFFPRTKKCLNQSFRSQLNHIPLSGCNNLNSDKDKTRTQLSKLHELYENMFDLNSCFAKHLNGDAVRAVSRCQSMTLSELCNGGENNLRNNDFENSSIASEPAYIANNSRNANDRLCENCKSSLTSIQNLSPKYLNSPHRNESILERLQSYRHMKNIMNLRHPDGASNPNLQEMEGNGKLNNGNKKPESASDDDEESAVPQPLTSKLLTLSREGFDGGGLFKKSCDSSDFVHGSGYEKFSNGLQMEQLQSHKGQYTRANVKKLQTYQVELRNKK